MNNIPGVTLSETVHPRDLFLKACVSFDIEVDPRTARVFDFAAVHGGQSDVIRGKDVGIPAALDQLETALGDARHLIGHNILRHDLLHLVALRPRLEGLAQAPIDTLWLNPLAFPRNPYHHLVKHYHNGQLLSGHVNDPEADARLVFDVLSNQLTAFRALNAQSPDAVAAYHFLTSRGENDTGFGALFQYVRRADMPPADQARQAIRRLLDGQTCAPALEAVLDEIASTTMGWPLAYALSWISVAGGDSVMPPWVRMQFPGAAGMVKRLRDTGCDAPDCAWCREKGDPVKALSRWFGFDAFRPVPTDADGRPLQERIVDEGMRGHIGKGLRRTSVGTPRDHSPDLLA